VTKNGVRKTNPPVAATQAPIPLLPESVAMDADLLVDLDAVKELASPAFSAMGTFNATFLDQMAAYQAELTSFLSSRLRANVEMPARLTNCKTVQDVQNAYLDFFNQATLQYQAEFERMMLLSRQPVRLVSITGSAGTDVGGSPLGSKSRVYGEPDSFRTGKLAVPVVHVE
jgi:hypothetical protein